MTQWITMDISTLLVAVAGAVIAYTILRHTVPGAALRIEPRMRDIEHSLLVLRIEVENNGRIRLMEPTIRLQVLEHQHRSSSELAVVLSGWVPFDRSRQLENEKPLSWLEPALPFKSPFATGRGGTKWIDPGETVSIEIAYCWAKTTVLTAALQIEAKWGIGSKDWQRTVTRMIEKPLSPHA
jgi:hypothetical protein